MPEGDSIHRLATELRGAVRGRQVRAFQAHTISDASAASLNGHTIVAVESRGKNLLLRFDDGRVLHVHLRMLGRVRVERAALFTSKNAYRRSLGFAPQTRPQLRFEAGDFVVTGSKIPVLELYASAQAERRAPDLAQLGPDLLAPEFDAEEALRRLREVNDREIGDALLYQRALAGIGNIYKSETLFLEGVDPRAPVGSLSDEALRAMMQKARRLLQRNLGSGPRVTRETLGGTKKWVYRRAGEKCFRCATPIDVFYQGHPPGRSTYFCPRCQAPAASAERESPPKR